MSDWNSSYFLSCVALDATLQFCLIFCMHLACQRTSNTLKMQRETQKYRITNAKAYTDRHRVCTWELIKMWLCGKHTVQLDIHICPNGELYKFLSSHCQQKVNQHPSFSLQCKQTCKWEPFFSPQHQINRVFFCFFFATCNKAKQDRVTLKSSQSVQGRMYILPD